MGFPADMAKAREQFKAQLTKRQAGIRQLESLNAELARARETQAIAQREEERCRQEMQAGQEDHGRARKTLAETLDRFLVEFYAWQNDLSELPLESREDWWESTEDWLDTRTGSFPLEESIAKAHRDAQTELLNHRGKLARQREGLEAEALEIGEALATLREGRIPEPPPPYTRAQDTRDARPGAPLWRLCGFREEIAPERRMGARGGAGSRGPARCLARSRRQPSPPGVARCFPRP